MKQLLVCILFVFCAVPAFAKDGLWSRTYGGSGNDLGSEIQQTADGGYIVSGGTYSFGAGGRDVLLVKCNSLGDTLWIRTYGGSGSEFAHSAQQTADGGYILAGETSSFGAGGLDAYLIKTDSLGNVVWSQTYGGSNNDRGVSVDQTEDGGYIVAGYTESFGAGYRDVYVIKTDSLGGAEWSRMCGGNGSDGAYSVQQTADGGYVVAGKTRSFGAGGLDGYLIKIDSIGDTLWTRTYGGDQDEHAITAQQTTDGGYIVAGYTKSFGAGYIDVYLIKTDSLGDTLWAYTYGGSDEDVECLVQQTEDGGYIVVGYTKSFGTGGQDVYLIKTDALGDTLWTYAYGGSQDELASSVQQTIDGGYIVAGWTESFGAGLQDVMLTKLDSEGNACMGEFVSPTVMTISPVVTSPATVVTSPPTVVNTPPTTVTSPTAQVSLVCYERPPTILSTSPTWNELGVAVSATILVTFDIDMDETSINNSTFVVNAWSTGLHQGTIAYDSGTRTATLTPSQDFAVGEIVNVVLTTDIQSSGGIPLDDSYTWSFTTEVSDESPGTFAPPVNYPAGDGPFSVFCADLDGDHDLDLAVANFNSDNVSILKNNGDGTFDSAVNYGAGYDATFVFCADLDSDHDLDLAVVNEASHNVSILKNNGDGTFASAVNYGVGYYPRSVFCADLDGDGDLDLAVANVDSDNISILKNNGDGTFVSAVNYGAGRGPWPVFCADLEGDNDLDLAAANSGSDKVSILKNNGDGTFASAVNYGVGYYPRSVFCADLDGDSDLDLAVPNDGSDNISILKNNGDGTFESAINYGAGDGPWSAFCADLDGDTDLDLAVANTWSHNLSILKNNGDGTFESVINYGAGDGPWSVFCADLDGDGDLDLALANSRSDNVSILLNVSGAICGTVTQDTGNPVENVTVKVIDSDNNQVGDPIVTGSDGTFYFDSLLVGTYSVMIVTPLGYSVSPGETQTGIEVTGYPCTQADFVLTPTIISNNCRTMGYWKHQFDVHLSSRGHAQEDSANLEDYLDLVHLHFDVLWVYLDLENFDFEDAKNVLTVKVGRLMEDRAKQQLFALLLNFASGRIGNESVISEDDRVAAEVVTYAATLINDGDPANDELAKTICDLINNGQMVESGVVPESPKRYKPTRATGIPMEFSLLQNCPNPFNPNTEIGYALPEDCFVNLAIYNILGQRVKLLMDEYQTAGSKTVTWNGKDDQGNEVASGIYFYMIKAGVFTQIKKMVLLR